MDLMTPITKFAATVPSTERVADMISMAVREAFNGAPGPVYLEIPRDILDREVELAKATIPKPGHYRASTRSIGDPHDIQKLADILVDSERPAILYGQQVWTARGHEEAIARLQARPRYSGLLHRRPRTVTPGTKASSTGPRGNAFGGSRRTVVGRPSTSAWATAASTETRPDSNT